MSNESLSAQGPVDVTVRLRNACYGGHGCKCTLNEAATEIERLRAALAELTREVPLGAGMTEVIYGHKAQAFARSVLTPNSSLGRIST